MADSQGGQITEANARLIGPDSNSCAEFEGWSWPGGFAEPGGEGKAPEGLVT